MDDLLGEDWQSAPKPITVPTKPTTLVPQFSAIRPQSGTATPSNLSRPSSTVNGADKPGSKPARDVFGNLTALKSQTAGSKVSIQEKQRQLEEEKRRQREQQASLWDSLGSGRGTPEVKELSSAPPLTAGDDVDDILAAFDRSAPVDRASHYPPPSSVVSGTSTPANLPARGTPPVTSNGGFDDDDDPFGLGGVAERHDRHVKAPASMVSDDNGEDVLGELARPVSNRPRRASPTDGQDANREEDETTDHGTAELIDMGFAPDAAKLALAESGGNVQSAVGWLLRQAHEESKQKAKSEAQTRRSSPPHTSKSPPRRRRENDSAVPAWMQEGRSSSAPRRQEDRSPAPTAGERDPAQVATELGSKLFKSANSIWKASQKQMAKTMAEFQQERDASQPKWMQEATSGESSRASGQPRQPRTAPRPSEKAAIDITNEAAMLDAPRESLPARPTRPANGDAVMRGRSTVELQDPQVAVKPKYLQQQQPPQARLVSKLSRQAVEEQTAQAYVSPARRKRPVPKADPIPEPEVDLFSPAAIVSAPFVPMPAPKPANPASRPSLSQATQPTATSRSVPSASPAALSKSAADRKKGGEAFKRGDYASAHDSYTSALSTLPSLHPIAIVVLSNRSLTALKTGDAKVAVSDAEQALAIIGPSQGTGETIDLGLGEGTRDMRDFFGKALMRKAEALEHMEKWTDAGAVWRQAISAGVGGAVSLQGRDRCERATAPKPKPKPTPVRKPATAPPAKPLGDSMHRPALTSAVSPEAVNKLRAANAAAEKADDEKFALTDQVDARLLAWKGGKSDNLRALLQSLDAVLWVEAGWKKVGMADLVMPNKVKIIYMKAIGKVHPDKIPQDATTEQRMISAAVFSTLNEAWDKFKKDNNL